MKKFFTAVAAIILCISLLTITVAAAVIPKPKDNFFVNDFADVISAADEQKMQAQGEALYKKCGAQVVVATVKTLDGSDIESYSLEMARSWKIGSDENDDGILLLLAVEERKVRIEVGYGLEGALPDSKTGRILDNYGMSYFKELAPNVAAGAIADKACDVAGFGRMALAYESFASDFLSDNTDRKKVCVACGKCTKLYLSGETVGCPVRDQSIYLPVLRRVTGKK